MCCPTGRFLSRMDETNFQPTMNTILADRLRLVALGVGAFFTILTSTHFLLQPEMIAPRLTAASALTALVAFGIYFYFYRRAIPPRFAHPIAALIAGVALVNFLVQLYLTNSPTQTANLLLLSVSLGFIFLSTNWLVLFLILISVGWSLVVQALPPTPEWLQFGFAQAAATALSLSIHLAQMQFARRWMRLRQQEINTKKELETVLKTTEKAQRSLAATMAVGQRIASILDLDDLLSQVVELIQTRFGFYAVSIYLLDETQEYIVLQAISDGSGVAGTYQGATHKIGEPGLPGWVIIRLDLHTGNEIRPVNLNRHPQHLSARFCTIPFPIVDIILQVLRDKAGGCRASAMLAGGQHIISATTLFVAAIAVTRFYSA